LELVVRRLAINTLKAHAALRHLVALSLANELETAWLTIEQRVEIHGRWKDAIRDEKTLRTILERAEREETLP
jgi:hypothetical protein